MWAPDSLKPPTASVQTQRVNESDMPEKSKGKYKLPTPQRLQKLLVLEKERRGVSADSLVFVGMHNIAQYFWCAMYAVLKSRRNELVFFAQYLEDRIAYSQELGLIEQIPRSDSALLRVGNDISHEDVEFILRQNAKLNEGTVSRTRPGGSEGADWSIDEDNPQLIRFSLGENEFISVPPLMAGQLMETIKSEQYPKISWNFEYGRYVVIGAPDGITDDFVYEFKSQNKRRYLIEDMGKASAQADLYGYFFRRENKRIQIYIREDDTTETYEGRVDIGKAQSVLENFGDVDAGWSPPPPRPWKCRSCECRQDCPIVQ